MKLRIDKESSQQLVAYVKELQKRSEAITNEDVLNISILLFYELWNQVHYNTRKNLYGEPMNIGLDYLGKFSVIFLERITKKLKRIVTLRAEDSSYYNVSVDIDLKYFKMLTELSIDLMSKFNEASKEISKIINENSTLSEAPSPLNKFMISEVLSSSIILINENLTKEVETTLVRFLGITLLGKLDKFKGV